MSDNSLQIERKHGIAMVKFDRPPANAIDLSLIRELDTTLQELVKADDLGAVILTGSGSCFSAGLDLKVVPSYNVQERDALVTGLNRMVGRLYGLPKPTVAAVNGHAIAGGLVIALACDYRIGTSDADCRLGLTEAQLGIPFPVAPMEVVASELGRHARRAVLLATNVGPEQALAWGALDELTRTDNVVPRAAEVANELAQLPRDAYIKIKRQFRADALERMQTAVSSGVDPMLETWRTAEMASAASLLGGAGSK